MARMSAAGKPISETGGYDEVRVHNTRTEYLLVGIPHRTDGPAIVTREGDEHWYLDGVRHRADGPALVSRNGLEQWWVDGLRVNALPSLS